MSAASPRRTLLIALLACAPLVSGCATGARGSLTPSIASLQLRELQTRDFEADDEQQVTKAVLNALQDEGFMVRNADAELGLISATREMTRVRRGSRFTLGRVLLATVTYGTALLLPRSEKTEAVQIEATISVAEWGPRFRVRASFVYRRIDSKGALVESHPVDDAAFYQAFFDGADKALFLARERI